MQIKSASLAIVLFCIGVTGSYAQSYQIPEIRAEVSIKADGTTRITERLTYLFEGSFSWAQYRLPKNGFSNISDIRVSENDQVYRNLNSDTTGSFSVAENDNAVRVRWHFQAKDEKRTFTISYTLHGAITVGPEWSQFYWNFVSADRDKLTNVLDISIHFPITTTTDSLYGWTREPAGRFDLQKSDSSFKGVATNINNDEFAKVRAVFPTRLLDPSETEINDSDFSLATVQQEEEAYQQELNRQQEFEAYWTSVSGRINYIIVILSVFFLYFFYQRYGKRHSTSRLSSAPTTVIPQQMRPAAIGWLMTNRTIMSGHLVATVLDLARQGYFKIEEGPPEEGFFGDDDPTFLVERTGKLPAGNLEDWEKQVIDFAERQLRDGTEELHKIFNSSSSDVSEWFADWQEQLEAYCSTQGWIDEESYIGAYWNAGVQFVLFAASLFLAIYTGSVASPLSIFAALFITLIAAILSLAIIRRTKKGEETYYRWKRYMKGLTSAKDHNIKADLLEHHLIYAVAFGVQKQKIEELFISADAVPVISWFIFSQATAPSAASAASTFSTLSATGTSSFAGTSAGGGASANAAGGGAAASAG